MYPRKNSTTGSEQPEWPSMAVTRASKRVLQMVSQANREEHEE